MIYVIPIVLAILGLLNNKGSTSKGAFLYWVTCISIILIFGLRYRVGGDTLNYMDRYEWLPELKYLSFADLFIYNLEPGFVVLCGIAKQFFHSFYAVQIFESCLANIAIFYYAKKKIGVNFLFVLLYFILLSFYFNTEIMREGCAVAFFLLGLLQYEKGNIAKFYIWMIPAVFFHYSSLFLLLFPLLNKMMVTPKRLIVWGAVALILLNFMNLPVIGGYLGAKIEENSTYHFSIWGKLVVFLKYVVFPYAILKFIKRNDSSEKSITIQNFLYVYMFFGILTIGPYSILMRLMNYLNPIFLIIVAYCFSKSFKFAPNTSFVRLSSLICLFVFYLSPYLGDTSHITRDTHFYCLWFPYHSIFDEQTDAKRETFVRAQFNELHERSE